MSPHVAAFPEAVGALEAILGWTGGIFPIRLDVNGDGLTWHQAGAPGLADRVRLWDEVLDAEAHIGLPRRATSQLGPYRCGVLWARIEGKDQLRRARAFRPLPTMVLREGSSTRSILLWWLNEPMLVLDAQDMNKRIAYRLRAVQKHADGDTLWIPLPGTCLRAGRARPVPIVVTRLTTASYPVAQVAGRLKDPPPADAWRQPSGGFR